MFYALVLLNANFFSNHINMNMQMFVYRTKNMNCAKWNAEEVIKYERGRRMIQKFNVEHNKTIYGLKCFSCKIYSRTFAKCGCSKVYCLRCLCTWSLIYFKAVRQITLITQKTNHFWFIQGKYTFCCNIYS